MAKRVGVSSVEFVKAFAVMAKQGKSAAEIGQALGMKGDAKAVAQKVSVRATQLRKLLKESAMKQAAAQNLSKEDTDALVKAMEDKLPRIKATGRKGIATELVAAIDSVLAEIDAVE